jgi:hypothetical protein
MANCRHNAPVRSRFLLLGLLPLTLAACGGSTSASSPPKSTTSAKASTKAVTIKVTSVVKTTLSHRQSAKVTTPGDRVDFVDDLLNTAPRFGKGTNEKVGSDAGTMTFTSKSTATMKGVATLPDGKIRFDGAVTVLPNNTVTVPVTGGTGTYKNASGTLLVGSGTVRATNTYTLVIAGIQGPIA